MEKLYTSEASSNRNHSDSSVEAGSGSDQEGTDNEGKIRDESTDDVKGWRVKSGSTLE